MKQKYFITVLLSLLFGITNAQNNALQMSNDSYFSSYNRNSSFYSDYYLNSTSFTIEYDFYLNASNNYNAQFSSFASNGVVAKPIHFYVNNTGASALLLGNGTTEEAVPGMPTFNAQQWYHIAFVVTNSGTKNVKVYVNGVPTIDYNFTATLDGFDGLTDINLGATSYSSTTNTGNAKYDNFRIWSSARTATEIANNYASCLVGNEPGLVSYFNFDGYNGRRIENLFTYSPEYSIFYIFNNYSFVSGSGCATPPLYDPITVTGDFNATFYYAGQINGKPNYKTDRVDCGINTSQARCASSPSYSEIIWENNQWIIRTGGCVWELGEACVPVSYSGLAVGINSNDTTLPPCAGWTSNVTVYTTHCTTLATTNQKLEENISIYPNPTPNILNVEVKEKVTIKVFDVMGKMILVRNNVLDSEKINLTNFPNGVYLVKVTDATGNNKSYKIIKE
ncbi:LamG-like jellyroll fold domain-containing protein [Flavobacterium salmonis]|uniref:Secretion system C-terminal sorting domain-containing protein n=1 Tax=Flavobacterium salmonis TaxID=2654844 RepID=A0A6V6YY26_9FLAO|nr:LamG-like jellyroll fold domain-containing protein [Flavobacterium salmonis]CAD0004390.1 hypothetical protein FLAT13_02238 [Flavobacterium salmonis]